MFAFSSLMIRWGVCVELLYVASAIARPGKAAAFTWSKCLATFLQRSAVSATLYLLSKSEEGSSLAVDAIGRVSEVGPHSRGTARREALKNVP